MRVFMELLRLKALLPEMKYSILNIHTISTK